MGYFLGFHMKHVEREYRAARGRDAKPLWISFLAFLLCYGAASLCVLLRWRGRGATDLRCAVAVRVGYVVAAMAVASALCRVAVRRSRPWRGPGGVGGGVPQWSYAD